MSNPTTRSAGPFAAVAGTMVLVFAAANAVSPLWPVYKTELLLSATALTFVFVGYTVGAMIALFAFGGLSDVIGRRPLLIVSAAATLIASLLFAEASSIWWLIAARFVQGIAVGAVSASANAALNDFSAHDPRRAALFGSLATSVGFAAGPFAAGLLADAAPLPMQMTFFVLIAFAAVALIALARLPNTGRREGTAFTANRANVPREIRGAFVRATATFFICWVSGSYFLSLGPSLIATLIGNTSHTVAGTTLLVFFASSTVAQIVARRYAALNVLRAANVIVAAGLFSAAIATLAHSLPLYFAAVIFTGAGQGIALLGGLELVNTIAPPAQRAGVIAAFFFIGYLGVTLGTPLLGWIADAHGLGTAAIAFAVVIMASAAVAFADLARWRPAADLR